MKKWIFNAIVAAIAAVIAILQEYWIGTSLVTIQTIGYGTLIGLCLSLTVEIVKKTIIESAWSWKAVGIGTLTGFVAALVAALAVC